MADPDDDPVLTAMKTIVDVAKATLDAHRSPDTEIALVSGLLEAATTFALTFGMPDLLVSLLFASSMATSSERVERAKAALAAKKAAQTTSTTPAPESTLTPAQVREILARLKEGGRVN